MDLDTYEQIVVDNKKEIEYWKDKYNQLQKKSQD